MKHEVGEGAGECWWVWVLRFTQNPCPLRFCRLSLRIACYHHQDLRKELFCTDKGPRVRNTLSFRIDCSVSACRSHETLLHTSDLSVRGCLCVSVLRLAGTKTCQSGRSGRSRQQKKRMTGKLKQEGRTGREGWTVIVFCTDVHALRVRPHGT